MRKVQTGKKFEIKAPRAESTTTEAFFSTTWTLLKQAIQQIYHNKSSELSYEELYRNTYKIVLNRHGESLYENVEACMLEQVEFILSSVLKKCPDELFLKTICNVWEEYKTETSVVSSVLMYLNTNYALKQLQQQQSQSSGNGANQTPVKHTLFVYDNGVEIFKRVVIYQSQSGVKIKNIVIEMIGKERGGEYVDRLLLKKVVRMLCEMNCYNDVLEEPFLETSAQYYLQLSRDLLAQTSITDYLKLVDERLREEDNRVQYYLSFTTKPKISKILRQEMITKHLDTITESPSGYISFLKDDKISELHRMYNLFLGNEEEHLSIMIKLYKQYITDVGIAYVMDEEKLQGSAVTFIEGLLEQKRKYDRITRESFKSNSKFEQAQKEGFSIFSDGTRQKRVSEYLSLYLDNTIRTLGDSEQELEPIMEDAMALFRFLRDKDIFENYYKVHLSKRLLSKGHQANSEKMFILKMKKECGYSFTSKIEGMFNDMKISAQTNEQYQQHDAFKLKPERMDFNVNILTHSFWPAYTLNNIILPADLNLCCESFAKFYNHIKELTQIPEKDLKKTLTILCMNKTKILSKEPKTKNLEDNHKFVLNQDFKNANYRVRLAITSTKETVEEVQETESKIELERKPVIEAVIVRVMKARKKLHHNELMSEVVKQLQSRFVPNPQEVKRRIENLIERDFLSREVEDHKTYNYVA
ncbi:predicted protein [Naegleria gruberi]|uniref:Predicted protein n=1 Tax=Naegleria gruberi TaxID=5762 RepID=D2W0W7_NAEGR|nr:uncharacterized protein NAEGRDRAFT_81967 [Naegleria gruberi]EFC37252.1 predicted protein [Naegleria gruberi]|eukprot:XP_002669996.1 predicted protein [Naegleria gruberi strain NEG-M]